MRLRKSHIFARSTGVAMALSMATAATDWSWAQTTEVTASHAKATYVVWIAQHVIWRDDDFPGKDSQIVIGVLGDNPFEKEKEFLESKRINSRKVKVQPFRKVEDVAGCQI